MSQVLAEENLNSIMDDIGCDLDPARVKAFVAKCPEGKATFTAIACMIFNKPYEDSNVFHDPEAEARTKAAESKAKAVTDRITNEKEAERKEQEERKKLEDKIKGGLEKVGVAGKAALFEQKSLKKDDPFTQAQKVGISVSLFCSALTYLLTVEYILIL